MPGTALLLLRVTLGLTALAAGVSYLSENASVWRILNGLFFIVCGISQLLGFLTPVSGILIFLSGAAKMIFPAALLIFESSATLIYVLVIAVSLILLGPGAFSLDAWIFGRREIIIPSKPNN